MTVSQAAQFGVIYYTEKDNESSLITLFYLTSRHGSVFTQHGFTLLRL